MPPSKNHQCSARWDERPKTSPSAGTARESSPTMSRLGPIFAADHSVRLQSYIGKPSWCSATGTTNFAPASLNRRAQSAAEKRSALNIGMKSL